VEKKLNRPILFITRTYPPILGGMENLSFNLIQSVEKLTPTVSIINPYGKKILPFFIPYAFFKAIFIIIFLRIRIVHLSDGVLAPIGLVLKLLFPWIKVVTNIHGLDLTYAEKFPPYYLTNVLAIRKLNHIIAVSNHTKDECVKYKIPESKITVIKNGVDTDNLYLPELKKKDELKNELWDKTFPEYKDKLDFKKHFVILFLGRLMKHKGITWFVKNIASDLSKKTIVLVAGGGPEESVLKDIIKQKKLNRVFMLGPVSDTVKKYLFNASDILVMPNLELPGFREGFGITSIEAASSGLVPVVADIQGLRDAVSQKVSGIRVPTADKEEFLKTIKYLETHPKYRKGLGVKARKYVKKHFDWSIIGKEYLEVFKKIND